MARQAPKGLRILVYTMIARVGRRTPNLLLPLRLPFFALCTDTLDQLPRYSDEDIANFLQELSKTSDHMDYGCVEYDDVLNNVDAVLAIGWQGMSEKSLRIGKDILVAFGTPYKTLTIGCSR